MINNIEKYENIIIDEKASLIQALKKMDESRVKLLIVLKKNKYYGLVSIGDIQRAIIQNFSLETAVSNVLRREVVIASSNDSIEEIKNKLFEIRGEFMPLIDENFNILNVYFWNDFFIGQKIIASSQLSLPVVIMAGGKGSRLKPITNVLPKALIPIDDKTMLERIIEWFADAGCKHFYISINYKSDFIRYYLDNLPCSNFSVEYVTETKPLGTIGSLYLLKDKITTPFFVSNCDILVKQDLAEVYKYHKYNSNEITIIAALKHIKIPYGILETIEEGQLVSITEKPTFTYKINSGVYLLQPELLQEIPENNLFNITDLIDSVLNRRGKVGVFPISENSWKDIGDWTELLKEYKLRS